MGQTADAAARDLEREIIAYREHIGRSLSLLEAQLRSLDRKARGTFDVRQRVRKNPLTFIAGGVVVLFLLAGGPRRIADAKHRRRLHLRERAPDEVERLYALPLLQDEAATLNRLPQQIRESLRGLREDLRWQHPEEEEKWLRAMVRGSTLRQLSACILFALLGAALEMLIKMLNERIRARTVLSPVRPFAPRLAPSSRVA